MKWLMNGQLLRRLRLLACGLSGVLALAIAGALSGCASPSTSPFSQPMRPDNTAHWEGKLSVKVYSAPVQSFSANFELQGSPHDGLLVLSSAIGTTLAELHWAPHSAILRTDSENRQFDSIESLAREVTGADIPVDSLFDWLAGQPGRAGHWTADLSDVANGRITAHNGQQRPQAELKIIFEH